MPNMVMNRNFTVSSTTGYCIRFRKDEPKHVADNLKLIQECQQYGARFVDKSDEPQLPNDDEVVTNLPKTPSERRGRILSLMTEMIANQEAHRTHFTGQGRPQVKYLVDVLGFDINAAEVEELWKGLVYPTPED